MLAGTAGPSGLVRRASFGLPSGRARIAGMMKKAILALVVAFLGFWLWTDPHGLATAARSVTSGGAAGASGLFTHVLAFLQAL